MISSIKHGHNNATLPDMIGSTTEEGKESKDNRPEVGSLSTVSTGTSGRNPGVTTETNEL